MSQYNYFKCNNMMNKKKALIGSFATVVAAGAIGVSVTSAHFGSQNENRAAVEDAIRNKNFKAFSAAIAGSPAEENIGTEKAFRAIIEAHNLHREGKHKLAKQALEDAGIERPYHKSIHAPRAEFRNAIENGDWAEFQQASQGKQIAKIINTEDKFNAFVEAYELRRNNRYEEANEIMEDLGLKNHKKMHGMRR